MPDATQKRANTALWLGLLLLLLAIFSNLLSFFLLSSTLVPWLNLVLPILALLFLLVGVVRAFRQPQIFRGKILGTSLLLLSLILSAGFAFFFYGARHIPHSGGAPQIGQRVPDFTLPDSTGQTVSLAQLFSSDSPTASQPKAVLLVFYRGYW